ncbi:Ig-like domain-containing protein (plasmid) [Vibrio sp. VNB-15]
MNPSKVSGTLDEGDVDVSFGRREGRKEEVDVKSTTAGTYQFSLDVQGSLETAGSQVIKFIGDAETATASIPANIRILPNGITTSQATVTVADANGNKLSGVTIALTSDDASDVITPAKAVTSAGGQAVFTVVSQTLGERTLEVIRLKDNETIGSSVVTASPRKYKTQGSATGVIWQFEAAGDEEDIGTTVKIGKYHVFRQKSRTKYVVAGGGDPGGANGAVSDVSGAQWILKGVDFYSREQKELLAQRCPDRTNFIIEGDSDGTWEGDERGRIWCATESVRAHVSTCGPTSVCGMFENRRTPYHTARTQAYYGEARPTWGKTIDEFLVACTDADAAGASTSFSITKNCSQLSFTGEPWQFGKTFTVEGNLQNNLGMPLGTLP